MRDLSSTRIREGERVYLRPLAQGDIPVLRAWLNSPEVTEHIGGGEFPVTEEMQEECLRTLGRSRTEIQLGIALKDSRELVGVAGIHQIDWIHRRGEVRIVIGDRSQWGKGIATEAIGLLVVHGFEKLNLRRLAAGSWAGNEGARRSLEKNGFSLEGTLRENCFHGSGYVDEYRFGLLRMAWEERQTDRAE